MPETRNHPWGWTKQKRMLRRLAASKAQRAMAGTALHRVPAGIRGAGRYEMLSSVDNDPRRSTELLFRSLAKRWRRRVEFMSSLDEMTKLEEYRQIIGMGWPVVPLLLRELEREPHFWFDALASITKSDPVAEVLYGDMRAMADEWLTWGRLQGIRW